MNNMLSDPMIIWPETPTIPKELQYFIDEGITIYGGTKGPFKLNGEKSVSTVIRLIELLKFNTDNKVDFINKLYEEEDGQYLIYLFTILNKNGCIEIQNENIFRSINVNKLNSFVNNYKSEKEIKDKFKNTSLKLTTNNQELLNTFQNSFFCINSVNSKNNTNWELREINNISDIEQVDDSLTTLIFANTNKGLIVGPILSRDALDKSSAIKYYSQFQGKFKSLSSTQVSLVHLITTKVISKLGEYNLDKGLYTFFNYKTEFVSKLDIYEDDNLDILEKFDIATSFSSVRYSNKNNHFAHYKNSNNLLSRESINTEFFKEYKGKIPNYLKNVIKYLNDFKNDIPNKKYTPTGGNINSNIIFYLNYDSSELYGEGIYIYNNIKKQMFQISDDTQWSMNCIKHEPQGYSGLILIGSDIDLIAQKYNDFGFKIGSLNTGILLATFLALKDTAFSERKYEFIEKFEEKVIIEKLGMSLKNLVINLIIGVKKIDTRNM